MTPPALVVDYLRAPIGRYGGRLAPVRADDLAAIPLRAPVFKEGETVTAGNSSGINDGVAALELHRRDLGRALATMCIGVGQGIAVLLEAP